jgi:hypothetical protein
MAEVEFSHDDGRTYAMATLSAEELIRLHHWPRISRFESHFSLWRHRESAQTARNLASGLTKNSYAEQNGDVTDPSTD